MLENNATNTRQWSRAEIAKKLDEYEKAAQDTPSQRQRAEQIAIPRSTLQHWLARKDRIDVDPEVVAFFESPAGVAFLHRLVLAAQFVMTLLGPCGIRLVCLFLELSGLDQFVAASYGSQQKVTVAMEEAVVTFGQAERERLAEGMPARQITVCQDETFHPDVCLVAIEPVSNFILLEEYADDRKGETWTQAMTEATAGLSVEIIQSTSDEGRGILHHVKEDLSAHHSPDLFHVQHELVKGTSITLANGKRQAEKSVEEAAEEVSRHREDKEAYFSRKRGPGRPPDFDKRIEQAQASEREARQVLETAVEYQEQVKQAIQEISMAYHPYDLETGAARSAEEVSSALTHHISEIEAVASEANLPQRCLKKINKAKRVVVDMVATIAFFFLTATAKVEALGLAPEVEQAVYDNLIPGIYLHLVAEKVETAQQRYELQQQADALLSPLRARDGPLGSLAKEDLVLIQQVAEECAQLFQRSSSCVEGRNGYLELRHRSLHRIRNRKLAALTTAHNYFVKRSDGTTAAERFFGSRPRDLFEWLLERVDLPGRPAQKRPQPKPKEYLAQAAA